MERRRGTNGSAGDSGDSHVVNSFVDMDVFDALPPALRHALNFSALKYGSEQVRDLGPDAPYAVAANENRVRAEYRARIGLNRKLP